MRQNKKRKVNLWRIDPYCCWCRRLTRKIMPEPGCELPDDAATIDHVYSKFQPAERIKYNNPVVLSCHACNRRRHILESKWLAKKAKADEFRQQVSL